MTGARMIKTSKFLVLVFAFALQADAHASFDRGLAAYRTGNYTLAYRDLSAAAQAGSADAQQLLGHIEGGQALSCNWQPNTPLPTKSSSGE